MAATEAGARLTEAHRLAQVQVSEGTTRLMARAWDATIDPFNLAEHSRFIQLGGAIVQTHAEQSALLSARYYATYRGIELGEPLAVDALADLPSGQVSTSLWVTGPVAAQRAQAIHPTERAMQIGRSMSARSASRLALEGGRQTIASAIQGDSRCVGYARATGGLSCAFCSMLASRGAVYKADTVRFRAHDGCNCTAEPRFDNDPELTPSAEVYRDLWDESTAGLSGDEARNAFRRALAEQRAS